MRWVRISVLLGGVAVPTFGQVRYTAVAQTGDAIFDTQGVARFGLGVLNASGQVAADVLYDPASLKHALVILPQPGLYNPIAVQGAVAPGAADGATFGSVFSAFSLNAIGQLTFQSRIGGDLNTDEATFTTPNPASESPISMFLTARKGSPAPGTKGAVYTRVGADNVGLFPPALGDGGRVAFVSGLAGGDTTANNEKALFAGSPAGPSLVVRQGDPTAHPGFDYWFDGAFPVPRVNLGGQIAFRASLHSGQSTYANGGLFLATPNPGAAGYTVAKVGTLREETPGVGGAIYGGFSNPSINGAGDVAFTATTTAVTRVENVVYAGKPDELTVVAHSGDAAPGSATTYGTMSEPLLSTNGAVTFTATIVADADHNTALYSGVPGKVRLVAREGDATPAGPGTYFGNFTLTDRKFMANGHGQVAFAASLTGPDVTPATSQALFATDRAGNLVLVARYGQTLDLGGGPKATGTWSTTYFSNGHDGLPSDFNDLGQILVKFATDSGTPAATEALVRATIPFPGDATGDGVVAIDDFRALYRHVNQAGGQAEGDFNHDGAVDFRDFQLLERYFGQSVSGAPVSVSAADEAALAAFAESAPEPGVIWCLVALPLVRRRRR